VNKNHCLFFFLFAVKSCKQESLMLNTVTVPIPPTLQNQIHNQPPSIRIPMLGHLQGLQPTNQQQNIQQPPSQQQQQQQQQSGTQNNIPPPPPQNGQDFTLSSVLHFLQTEWRRYERDRNEWEIERAEMRAWLFLWSQPAAVFNHTPQARIALLEGERRSFENVKLDLMRRIKMLEYALRMER
jgi:striatin 1/3/4